ncbi:MAG: helicase associated domain-containing protein, partial [Parcubacteria group bacterium]|nr:helicase associated domain-containing protein [Parcubacteria group bacterium]
FDDPQQLVRANKAWEDLSACTELLECHVPDPKKSETWPIILALTHRAVWAYRQRGGTPARLRTALRQYILVDKELRGVLGQWWGEKAKRSNKDLPWGTAFCLLIEFRKECPDTWPFAGQRYRGFALGAWCNYQRSRRHWSGRRRLHEWQRKKLDSIGFPWEMREWRWYVMYAILKRFRVQHPDRWPAFAEMFEGKHIGHWCNSQRQARRWRQLDTQKVHLLTQLGFPWNPHADEWESMFRLLLKYRKKFPTQWPEHDKKFHGKWLGLWCISQRQYKKKGILDPEHVSRLDAIGFPWDPYAARWHFLFDLLKEFRIENPDRWPDRDEVYRGEHLGQWCQNQRNMRRTTRRYELREETIQRLRLLDSIGFPWSLDVQFVLDMCSLLASFREEYPHRWPKREEVYRGKNLGDWLRRQRDAKKKGKLKKEIDTKLKAMGAL